MTVKTSAMENTRRTRRRGSAARLVPAVGVCAALGALLTGCGDDNKVSGTASAEKASTSASTASTTTSRTPAGFTTAPSEIEAMLEAAHAGVAPVYCEVSDATADGEIWLRGGDQYMMTVSQDGVDVGMIREDSVLWIWNETRSEGLMMTSADGDMSELDSRVIFDDSIYETSAGETARCRPEAQNSKYAAPADVTFFTTADVASGKFSAADAEELLGSFDSFGS